MNEGKKLIQNNTNFENEKSSDKITCHFNTCHLNTGGFNTCHLNTGYLKHLININDKDDDYRQI